MADIQILGANTDTRSQIKNLWASVNKISNFLNTIGSYSNASVSLKSVDTSYTDKPIPLDKNIKRLLVKIYCQ